MLNIATNVAVSENTRERRPERVGPGFSVSFQDRSSGTNTFLFSVFSQSVESFLRRSVRPSKRRSVRFRTPKCEMSDFAHCEMRNVQFSIQWWAFSRKQRDQRREVRTHSREQQSCRRFADLSTSYLGPPNQSGRATSNNDDRNERCATKLQAQLISFAFTRRADTMLSIVGVGCGTQTLSHRPKHWPTPGRHTYCVQLAFASHCKLHRSQRTSAASSLHCSEEVTGHVLPLHDTPSRWGMSQAMALLAHQMA